MDRNQWISNELERLEEEYDIKIIYAVESGSRAWGFASPDSDYDVRFIYKRPKECYLKLKKSRDTLEFMLPGDLDLSGWDIDKALKLLHASNPSLIEWIRSPIVYKTTPDFDLIANQLDRYFSVRTGACHYLSMAKNNYSTYFRGDTVSVKKYFYVLRPILAARYILKTKTPPPVPFDELAQAEMEQELQPYIDELLAVKRAVKEMHPIPRVKTVDEYIEENLNQIETALSHLPRETSLAWGPLDELFCRLIGVWDR